MIPYNARRVESGVVVDDVGGVDEVEREEEREELVGDEDREGEEEEEEESPTWP